MRHGEAESNAVGYLTSAVPGPGLTPRGQRQARAVAKVLSVRLGAPPAVVTSPLRRALETSLPTAQRFGATPRVEPGLRELTMGAWEGRRAEELLGAEPSFGAWRADPEAYRPPGGERASDVGARVRGALERLAGETGEGCLVAFSHQDALGALLTSVSGGTWSGMHGWKDDLPNAVIAHLRLDARSGRWRLVGLDLSASHAGDLEPEAAASTAP